MKNSKSDKDAIDMRNGYIGLAIIVAVIIIWRLITNNDIPKEPRINTSKENAYTTPTEVKSDRTKLSKEDREFLEYNDKLLEKRNEVTAIKSAFEENCLKYGYCMNLAILVQSEMHDPKSFEHVETTYRIEGNYAIIYMKFRGTNAFGAKVLNRVKAKISSNCDVISIETLK